MRIPIAQPFSSYSRRSSEYPIYIDEPFRLPLLHITVFCIKLYYIFQLICRSQFGTGSGGYSEASVSTQSASQSGRGTSMVSSVNIYIFLYTLYLVYIILSNLYSFSSLVPSSGAAPQGGQCEAHERTSFDATVSDWWPRWLRTDLGMGTPATGLLSTHLRHLCQGHTLSLLRAGQQVWRRRWRWQIESVAGGNCLPE